jgi:hypothetical protein
MRQAGLEQDLLKEQENDLTFVLAEPRTSKVAAR